MKVRTRVALSIVLVVVLVGGGLFAPFPVREESKKATLHVGPCYKASVDAFGERWQVTVVSFNALQVRSSYEGRLVAEVAGVLRPEPRTRKATFVLASGERVPVYDSDGFTTMDCAIREGDDPSQILPQL